MLREAIQLAYRKSVGTLKDGVEGLSSSVTQGGGMVPILYVVFLVCLMSGFIDALAYPVPNQIYIPLPSTVAMTIPEAVVDAMIILLGGAGIYLTYMSGRQTAKSRAVNLYLGLALLMLVVSLFAGIQMAILKGFG